MKPAGVASLKSPQIHWGQSITVALVIHLFLILALSWGIHWNQKNAQVDAEFQVDLISDVFRMPPAPAPVPVPPPELAAKDTVPEDQHKSPDIVSSQLKKRLDQELEKKKQEQLKKKQEQLQQQVLEEQQQRLSQLAKKLPPTTSSAAAAKENAARSAPVASSGVASAQYASLVIAKIRPNIIYTDTGPGNPQAVVEVQCAPSGTILQKRLVQSSGVAAWDQAVLRAIDRTGSLPKNQGGSVPERVEIVFSRYAF